MSCLVVAMLESANETTVEGPCARAPTRLVSGIPSPFLPRSRVLGRRFLRFNLSRQKLAPQIEPWQEAGGVCVLPCILDKNADFGVRIRW